MAKPGLRDTIKAISPSWLQSGNAEKYLYMMGLAMDCLLEKLNQGVRIHMPGYGDSSGLPYVGADRLIPQGLTETATAYAIRLKSWLDDWRIAGTAHAVLQQLRGYVSLYNPIVRTVTDSSAWDVYIDTDNPQAVAPAHYLFSNWDWDGDTYDPHPTSIPTQWWRWWLIMLPESGTSYTITGATNTTPITVTTSQPHGMSTGGAVHITGVIGNTGANDQTTPSPDSQTLPWIVTVPSGSTTTFQLNGSAGTGSYIRGGTATPCFTGAEGTWGDGDIWDLTAAPTKSWGLSVNAGLISGIRSLVGLWKSGNSWCRWMIITFNNNRFGPDFPLGSENPPGTFGPWYQITGSGAAIIYSQVRYTDGRYCDGIA